MMSNIQIRKKINPKVSHFPIYYFRKLFHQNFIRKLTLLSTEIFPIGSVFKECLNCRDSLNCISGVSRLEQNLRFEI